jgi:hypothetical protein
MIDTLKAFINISLVCYLFFCTLFLFITSDQRNELREQAVDRGYAEWVFDENDGTTWRWKEGVK